MFPGLSAWQGKKDSNPQQRFWRPTCYHYTIPLCNGCIIPQELKIVNHIFREKGLLRQAAGGKGFPAVFRRAFVIVSGLFFVPMAS